MIWVPYGKRDDRQGDAGRSQVGNPSAREASRISALVMLGLDQRMAHAALLGGLNPRPIVVQVIEIDAVDDLRDPEFARLGLAHREQVALAQVASIERILRVALDLELVGFDYHVARADELAPSRLPTAGPDRASSARWW